MAYTPPIVPKNERTRGKTAPNRCLHVGVTAAAALGAAVLDTTVDVAAALGTGVGGGGYDVSTLGGRDIDLRKHFKMELTTVPSDFAVGEFNGADEIGTNDEQVGKSDLYFDKGAGAASAAVSD